MNQSSHPETLPQAPLDRARGGQNSVKGASLAGEAVEQS